MKKFIALLLALCMVACLFAGCKEEEATTPSSDDTTSSTPEAMGSRVPAWPILRWPRRLSAERQRADVGPEGLLSTRTPSSWGSGAGLRAAVEVCSVIRKK